MPDSIRIIQLLGHSGANKSKSVGGAEIFAYDLLKNMDRKKYKHIVLYATDSAMTVAFERIGIKVIKHNLQSRFDFFGILGLYKIVKQNRINIIHSHAVRYDFAAMIVAVFMRIPLIITRHVAITDYLLPKMKKSIYMFFDWLSLFGAKMIIAISNDCRNKINRYYPVDPKKIFVIYCGIDFDKLSASRSWPENVLFEDDKKNNTIIIGTVAQLTYYKGIDTLIRAFQELIIEFPNIRLIIVGDGAERKKLEELSVKLKIEKNVRFLGLRSDVHNILPLFDIFALPSRREGLPLSILEAMYFERPIVASNVGAVGEIVQPGKTGILIDPDNTKQIYDAIKELMLDPSKRAHYGKQGYQLVTTKFGISQAVENYAKIYSRLYQFKKIHQRDLTCMFS